MCVSGGIWYVSLWAVRTRIIEYRYWFLEIREDSFHSGPASNPKWVGDFCLFFSYLKVERKKEDR